MPEQKTKIIGVMSGTSLDGVDIAELIFSESEGNIRFEILQAQTIPYAPDWVEKLSNSLNYSLPELEILDQNYTEVLGKIIKKFISENNIQNIATVASHGHTVLHQPHNGITLQIGNLPKIAKIIGQKVVCDFRIQDVKYKGQGAPLVPIGDQLLFPEYDYCLNLGGFSNISFEKKAQRIAYDICAVNTVLNYYALKLGYAYDDKGSISAKGYFDKELFEYLNQLEFYQKPHPKSLGYEYVKAIILPITENYSAQTVLRTFTEHIAHQISLNITNNDSKLLITGGGAYNTFLISRIRHYLPKIEIIIPSPALIEYKEALIFGLLGYLRLNNRINVLSSVTGSTHDHSSGFIYE